MLTKNYRDHLNQFSEEQRVTILQWASDIAKPRRERRSISRFGNQFDTLAYLDDKKDKKDKKYKKEKKKDEEDEDGKNRNFY